MKWAKLSSSPKIDEKSLHNTIYGNSPYVQELEKAKIITADNEQMARDMYRLEG